MVKKIRKDLTSELKKQADEFESKWKRALADYQNLQKRVENERSSFAKMANAILISEILGIVDDLERAAKYLKDEGLNIVVKRLEDLLKREGVEEIEAGGKEFDPEIMEAVENVEGQKNKVMRVVQKGYMMGQSVLRPAKVEVGNGK